MADLTVIIAIKNEGDRLRDTLKSLRSTQDQDVEVLVINDASNDDYDYDALCKEYDSRIITNKVNLGTGPSKHLGTQNIKTKNFIIIDGHMRFRNDKWVSKIDKAINDNPKSVMCTGCGYIDDKKLENELSTQKDIDTKLHKHGWRGASIKDIEGYKAMWLPNKYWGTIEAKGTHQIPTIMGASYCSNIEWYNHIGGMERLLAWGKEEETLSWKSWRFGGDARVILEVFIGHIWKTRGKGITFDNNEVKANRYISAMVTLPKNHLEKAMKQIRDYDKNQKGWQVVKRHMAAIMAEADRVNAADPDSKHFERLLECNKLITSESVSADIDVKPKAAPSRIGTKRVAAINPPTQSTEAILGISVIIPVSDNEEIPLLPDLIDKAGTKVEIIIVNDGVDAGNRVIAEANKCKYFEHAEPRGVAKCIESGVEMATGSIICYLPAAHKVIKPNWAINIYDTVIKAPRGLYGIGFTESDGKLNYPQRYFSPELELKTYPVNHKALVPTIPNTGFAMHKSYFRRLRKLSLLKGGAMIGLNLSIKVWREGGFVKSMPNRHFQITEHTNTNSIIKLYDKLITILTLIPESDIGDFIEPILNETGFEEAMGLIDINSADIDGLRFRLEAILNRTCQALSKANDVFRKVYK